MSGGTSEVSRRVASTIVEYMAWTLRVDRRRVCGRRPAWGVVGGGEEGRPGAVGAEGRDVTEREVRCRSCGGKRVDR